MSNKDIGNVFEVEVCKALHDLGYWVHRFQQNKDGQPADIIAINHRSTYLIDAKYCTGGFFRLNRMEINQRLSMSMFETKTGHTGVFVLGAKGVMRVLAYDVALQMEKRGYVTLNYTIVDKLPTLEEYFG